MGTADHGKEYREVLEALTKEFNEGARSDGVALDALKNARNTLQYCTSGRQPRGKRRQRSRDPIKQVRQKVVEGIWKQILHRYTLPKHSEMEGFEKEFTRQGLKGYKNFQNAIASCMRQCLQNDDNLAQEEMESFQVEAEKPGGFLENLSFNMEKKVWDFLVEKLVEGDTTFLGNPGMYKHRRELCAKWSKELAMAKADSNVKYANKMVQFGEVSIVGDPKGTRPSRVVPNVRSIHFLKPEQVQNANHIGKGIQGDVYTCHIVDCPLIPVNAVVVAKRFKDGDKHKRRADALQEVLMGGLNHKGIVGALAMTIEDPPKLIYDHYNGGDMGSFMDRCGK